MSTSTDLVLCATSDAPSTTRALAAAVADLLVDGDLLVLTGDLGAGKTCFTQGLGVGLGVTERITSPTFTLASEYEGRLRLHHLDVYRLDGAADTVDLDLHELAEDGVTVVEWGEQIDNALGDDRLIVELGFFDPEPQFVPHSERRSEPEHGDEPSLATIDDRRHLRLSLVGATWQSRHERLRAAIETWAVPC